MIEDQVHQHPVRLPPDKNAHIDVTSKFEKYVQQLLHDNYIHYIQFSNPRVHVLNFFIQIRRDTIFLVFSFFRDEIENTFITLYLSMHEISMLRILAYSNAYISRYVIYAS